MDSYWFKESHLQLLLSCFCGPSYPSCHIAGNKNEDQTQQWWFASLHEISSTAGQLKLAGAKDDQKEDMLTILKVQTDS